jgi:hypothetical protein
MRDRVAAPGGQDSEAVAVSYLNVPHEQPNAFIKQVNARRSRCAPNEADGDGMGGRAGDVADRSGSVPVVLVVVGLVDRVVTAGIGVAEDDVTGDPAGADASGAAGKRPAVPRPVWPASIRRAWMAGSGRSPTSMIPGPRNMAALIVLDSSSQHRPPGGCRTGHASGRRHTIEETPNTTGQAGAGVPGTASPSPAPYPRRSVIHMDDRTQAQMKREHVAHATDEP